MEVVEEEEEEEEEAIIIIGRRTDTNVILTSANVMEVCGGATVENPVPLEVKVSVLSMTRSCLIRGGPPDVQKLVKQLISREELLPNIFVSSEKNPWFIELFEQQNDEPYISLETVKGLVRHAVILQLPLARRPEYVRVLCVGRGTWSNEAREVFYFKACVRAERNYNNVTSLCSSPPSSISTNRKIRGLMMLAPETLLERDVKSIYFHTLLGVPVVVPGTWCCRRRA